MLQVFVTLFVALLLRDPTLTGWWVIGFDAVLTLVNCATPLAAATFIARAESVAMHRKEVMQMLAGSVHGADGADAGGEGVGSRPSLLRRVISFRLPTTDSPIAGQPDEVTMHAALPLPPCSLSLRVC